MGVWNGVRPIVVGLGVLVFFASTIAPSSSLTPLVPIALRISDPGGNGVIDPGETAVVRPVWANTRGYPFSTSATVDTFTGPGAPTLYAVVDGAATYQSNSDATLMECRNTTLGCYKLRIQSGAGDATFAEHLPGQNKTWSLPVGGTFTDVPTTSKYEQYILALTHGGVAGGCGSGIFCPLSVLTREQFAVFAVVGAGVSPPSAAGDCFSDVPAVSPFAKYIEYLGDVNAITCNPTGTYGPGEDQDRGAVAKILLRVLEGPSYNPPPATGKIFRDVPKSNPFAPFIEELARRKISDKCGKGKYCPAAGITRQAMARFVARTFGITLYHA